MATAFIASSTTRWSTFDQQYGAEDYVSIDPADSARRSLDFSDIEGAVIAAVAVGPDRRIASHSNGCGVAWRWCLAAPGARYRPIGVLGADPRCLFRMERMAIAPRTWLGPVPPPPTPRPW